MGGVTIQNGRVTSLDLTGVIQDDNLSVESSNFSSGIILGIRGNITSFKIFNGNVFDVETNIVSGDSFLESFMMHFNGFTFSGDHSGSES